MLPHRVSFVTLTQFCCFSLSMDKVCKAPTAYAKTECLRRMRAVLLVCTLLAAGALGAEHLATLQGSVDGGRTWTTKAVLRSTGGAVAPSVKIVGDVPATWDEAAIAAFRKPDTVYHVRVVDGDRSTADGAAAAVPPEAVRAAVALNPCNLVMAKQYQGGAVAYLNERYGVALAPDGSVAGLRLTTTFSELCDLHTAFKGAANVRQKVAVSRLPELVPAPLKIPDPPGVKPGEKPKKKVKTADGKEEEAEEDNRSFFQKYWWYIVIFLGFQLVSAFINPPQAGQKRGAGAGGAGRAAAAPAAK